MLHKNFILNYNKKNQHIIVQYKENVLKCLYKKFVRETQTGGDRPGA